MPRRGSVRTTSARTTAPPPISRSSFTCPSEGAYPSGLSAMASAAHTLHLLTADERYLRAANAAMELFAPLAVPRPISFGASLGVMTRLQAPGTQLVVVRGTDAAPIESIARNWDRAGGIVAIVTTEQAGAFAEAGFELFDGRVARDGQSTAYLCRDFVCRLPVVDSAELERQLADA